MTDDTAHLRTAPCPACGRATEIPSAPTGAPLQCAACGEQFFVEDEEESDGLTHALQDTPPDRAGDFAQELDGLRIRRLSALRRANYRSQSYALIAAMACAVTAIQLSILMVRMVGEGGWTWRIAPSGSLAVVAMCLAVFFARRAIALRREL